MPPKNSSAIDIFDLLSDSRKKTPAKNEAETKTKTQREEFLGATKVKDLFPEGSIAINKHTCVGVQCKLCIKACPTNALYWTSQGIEVIEDLCVHCDACVLCCMVDDCIRVTRKREDGKEERFSKARDILRLRDQGNARSRFRRISEIFPSAEEYCRKYSLSK
jgi:Na+-translocating ferredoxin:NAD+ oxidoreductase RNF subunit RnfB